MKLKRVLIIVMAGIETLLLALIIRSFAIALRLEYSADVGFYAQIISYVSNIEGIVRDICLLAVVDFVFCLGQKGYSKCMLGIAIAMFAFKVALMFEAFILLGLNVPSFMQVIIKDQYTGIAYFYLWTALTTLPFVGLAVAYIVTKHKYLKQAHTSDTL